MTKPEKNGEKLLKELEERKLKGFNSLAELHEHEKKIHQVKQQLKKEDNGKESL